MPAYNAEDYVAAALDSVLGQTWSNLEIIVVNDGSTDGTAGVLDRYSDEARVTVIHQENQGAAAARNRGFEASTGDYIQYLDADDLLHPRKVEAQMAVLDDHTSETVAVCSTVYFQDGDPPEQGHRAAGEQDIPWLTLDDPVQWLVIFDQFAGHSVSTVGRMISEGDWWGGVAERCGKMGVSEVPLLVGCVYYIQADSTARSVYETARELKENHTELGTIPLRGSPNEEPLVSLDMALHGQEPIPDDGRVKADAMSYPSGIEIDVFEGTVLFKDYTDQNHLTGTLREARPAAAHFNDTYTEKSPYTQEATRLENNSTRESICGGVACFGRQDVCEDSSHPPASMFRDHKGRALASVSILARHSACEKESPD